MQAGTNGIEAVLRTGRKVLLPSAMAALLLLGGCGWAEWPPRDRYRAGVPGPSPYDSQNLAAATEAIVVRRGDTLWGLSRHHKVDLKTLIETNRLSPPYVLHVGQRLAVPRGDGHVVARGDTIYSIANAYGADPYEMARANRIAPPYRLTVGDRLYVPRSTEVAAPQPAPPAQKRGTVVAESLDSPASGAPSAVKPETQVAAPALPTPAAAPTAEPVTHGAPPGTNATTNASTASLEPAYIPGSGFLWPVRGKVVSGFGSKAKGLRNDGINIAAPAGAPIRAAQDGVVVYAGNELRGFGNLILVRHDDGYVTAYAHADRLLAQRGDKVRRGQIIARVGSTGSVASPQLHFEIRQGKRAHDPVALLGA